jgi:hypothetical protein
MSNEWTRTERLTLYSLLVAIVGVSVALLTVPEFRRMFKLTEPMVIVPQATPVSSSSSDSSQPPPKQSSPKVTFSKRVEVRADQVWVDTGIEVTGKKIRIEYESGQWSNGGDEPLFADGRGANSWPGLLVPNAPIRSLVGKTSSSTFFVGNLREGVLGQGRLYLS